MDRERPGEDATAAEIAEWMEQDFWGSVTEGMEAAFEENEEE